MISAIVAVDENWGIGSNNKLLASIPEDMRFFKEKTTNSVVIMGRKTYNSLPVKPLPNRVNIVVTSKIDKPCEIDNNGVIFCTMEFIKTFLGTRPSESLFNYYIIGGGIIYKELLPYCEKAYITKIHRVYGNADTYFPNIDEMSEWEMELASEIKKYRGIEYQFCTYKNKGVLSI